MTSAALTAASYTRTDYSPAVALTILRAMKRRRDESIAEWHRDAAEDRRNGYRPHYCLHGKSNWTDYDNICGGCEDGDTVYATHMEAGVYERAIGEARVQQRRMVAMSECIKTARAAGIYTQELANALVSEVTAQYLRVTR
jgi:hypothetical protein